MALSAPQRPLLASPSVLLAALRWRFSGVGNRGRCSLRGGHGVLGLGRVEEPGALAIDRARHRRGPQQPRAETGSDDESHRGAIGTGNGNGNGNRTPCAGAGPRELLRRGPAQARAKGRPMGWYSVDGSLSDERFWDGRTWTARRQLVAGTWSPVPPRRLKPRGRGHRTHAPSALRAPSEPRKSQPGRRACFSPRTPSSMRSSGARAS